MARNKINSPNINTQDPTNYPNGRIQNNDGSGNGTPVNEFIYGDIHEFFAKLMREYSISYNGAPDNENNGYQLVDALFAFPNKNNIMQPISNNGGQMYVPIKIGKMKPQEMLICRAITDFNNNWTSIRGLDGVVRNITISSGDKFFIEDVLLIKAGISSTDNFTVKKIAVRNPVNGFLKGVQPSQSQNVDDILKSQNIQSLSKESNTNTTTYVLQLNENVIISDSRIDLSVMVNSFGSSGGEAAKMAQCDIVYFSKILAPNQILITLKDDSTIQCSWDVFFSIKR